MGGDAVKDGLRIRPVGQANGQNAHIFILIAEPELILVHLGAVRAQDHVKSSPLLAAHLHGLGLEGADAHAGGFKLGLHCLLREQEDLFVGIGGQGSLVGLDDQIHGVAGGIRYHHIHHLTALGNHVGNVRFLKKLGSSIVHLSNLFLRVEGPALGAGDPELQIAVYIGVGLQDSTEFAVLNGIGCTGGVGLDSGSGGGGGSGGVGGASAGGQAEEQTQG